MRTTITGFDIKPPCGRRRRGSLVGRGPGGAALAQQPAPQPPAPPRVKGPPVWLDLDQKELDDAYDQSEYAPNTRTVLQRTDPQQRTGARTARRSQAICLRPDADRGARCLHHQDAERARSRLHPWRRLACRLRQGLPLSGRDVRQCRREFRGAGLRQRHRERRRSARHGRPGAALGGLGLQERQELRRRSRPLLHQRSFFRRPLGGVLLTTDWQKDFGLPPNVHQGRCRGERHVRSEAGAALGAFELREASPTKPSTSSARSVISTSSSRRSRWFTAPWRRRSSSVSRATSRPP